LNPFTSIAEDRLRALMPLAAPRGDLRHVAAGRYMEDSRIQPGDLRVCFALDGNGIKEFARNRFEYESG
jgi:hypothetical protein